MNRKYILKYRKVNSYFRDIDKIYIKEWTVEILHNQ